MLGTLVQASSATGGRLAVQCKPGTSHPGASSQQGQQQTLRPGTHGSPDRSLSEPKVVLGRNPGSEWVWGEERAHGKWRQ